MAATEQSHVHDYRSAQWGLSGDQCHAVDRRAAGVNLYHNRAGQGVDGLETIFHEGAHLITKNLSNALEKECEAQKKQCADLWHAVQFYTVGEIVKQELVKRGTLGYTPLYGQIWVMGAGPLAQVPGDH